MVWFLACREDVAPPVCELVVLCFRQLVNVTLFIISGAICLHLPTVGFTACLAVQLHWGLLTHPTPSGKPGVWWILLGTGFEILKMEKNWSGGHFCKPHMQIALLRPGSSLFSPRCGLARWWAASGHLVGKPSHRGSSGSPPGRRRQNSLWIPGMRWISWRWSCRKSSRR